MFLFEQQCRNIVLVLCFSQLRFALSGLSFLHCMHRTLIDLLEQNSALPFISACLLRLVLVVRLVYADEAFLGLLDD